METACLLEGHASGWLVSHVPSWTASLSDRTLLGILQDLPALILELALGPGSG